MLIVVTLHWCIVIFKVVVLVLNSKINLYFLTHMLQSNYNKEEEHMLDSSASQDMWHNKDAGMPYKYSTLLQLTTHIYRSSSLTTTTFLTVMTIGLHFINFDTSRPQNNCVATSIFSLVLFKTCCNNETLLAPLLVFTGVLKLPLSVYLSLHLKAAFYYSWDQKVSYNLQYSILYLKI